MEQGHSGYAASLVTALEMIFPAWFLSFRVEMIK